MFTTKKALIGLGAGVSVAAIVIAGPAGVASAKSLITGAGIKNGTIHRADLAPALFGKLNGQKGATGATGAKGATGAAGANGKDGAQGPAGKDGAQGPAGKDGTSVFANSYVHSESFVVPAHGHADHTTSCNTGDLAVGGGFSFSLNEQGFSRVLQNRMDWSQAAQTAAIAAGKAADANPDGWYVEATGGDNDAKGYVWATCLAS